MSTYFLSSATRESNKVLKFISVSVSDFSTASPIHPVIAVLWPLKKG
jgi:hypothetical protein